MMVFQIGSRLYKLLAFFIIVASLSLILTKQALSNTQGNSELIARIAELEYSFAISSETKFSTCESIIEELLVEDNYADALIVYSLLCAGYWINERHDLLESSIATNNENIVEAKKYALHELAAYYDICNKIAYKHIDGRKYNLDSDVRNDVLEHIDSDYEMFLLALLYNDNIVGNEQLNTLAFDYISDIHTIDSFCKYNVLLYYCRPGAQGFSDDKFKMLLQFNNTHNLSMFSNLLYLFHGSADGIFTDDNIATLRDLRINSPNTFIWFLFLNPPENIAQWNISNPKAFHEEIVLYSESIFANKQLLKYMTIPGSVFYGEVKPEELTARVLYLHLAYAINMYFKQYLSDIDAIIKMYEIMIALCDYMDESCMLKAKDQVYLASVLVGAGRNDRSYIILNDAFNTVIKCGNNADSYSLVCDILDNLYWITSHLETDISDTFPMSNVYILLSRIESNIEDNIIPNHELSGAYARLAAFAYAYGDYEKYHEASDKALTNFKPNQFDSYDYFGALFNYCLFNLRDDELHILAQDAAKRYAINSQPDNLFIYIVDPCMSFYDCYYSDDIINIVEQAILTYISHSNINDKDIDNSYSVIKAYRELISMSDMSNRAAIISWKKRYFENIYNNRNMGVISKYLYVHAAISYANCNIAYHLDELSAHEREDIEAIINSVWQLREMLTGHRAFELYRIMKLFDKTKYYNELLESLEIAISKSEGAELFFEEDIVNEYAYQLYYRGAYKKLYDLLHDSKYHERLKDEAYLAAQYCLMTGNTSEAIKLYEISIDAAKNAGNDSCLAIVYRDYVLHYYSLKASNDNLLIEAYQFGLEHNISGIINSALYYIKEDSFENISKHIEYIDCTIDSLATSALEINALISELSALRSILLYIGYEYYEHISSTNSIIDKINYILDKSLHQYDQTTVLSIDNLSYHLDLLQYIIESSETPECKIKLDNIISFVNANAHLIDRIYHNKILLLNVINKLLNKVILYPSSYASYSYGYHATKGLTGYVVWISSPKYCSDDSLIIGDEILSTTEDHYNNTVSLNVINAHDNIKNIVIERISTSVNPYSAEPDQLVRDLIRVFNEHYIELSSFYSNISKSGKIEQELLRLIALEFYTQYPLISQYVNGAPLKLDEMIEILEIIESLDSDDLIRSLYSHKEALNTRNVGKIQFNKFVTKLNNTNYLDPDHIEERKILYHQLKEYLNMWLKDSNIVSAYQFNYDEFKEYDGIIRIVRNSLGVYHAFLIDEHSIQCNILGDEIFLKTQIKAIRNELFHAPDINHRHLALYQLSESLGVTKMNIPPTASQKLKILIIPDGVFYALPFELLCVIMPRDGENARYFAEYFDCVYCPSLSAYSVLHSRANINNHNNSNEILLAAANPFNKQGDLTKRSGLYNIPHVEREVNNIARSIESYCKHINVLPPDAVTEEKILDNIDSYRVIHIASHAFNDIGQIENTGLIIESPRIDMNTDGIISPYDILAKDINADIVTLSACATGAGEYENEYALTGLSSAFLVSGAKSVVVSLWPVDDEATALLFSEMYRNIADNMSASHALAEAKRTFIQSDKYSNPYYWAPFIIIGASPGAPAVH